VKDSERKMMREIEVNERETFTHWQLWIQTHFLEGIEQKIIMLQIAGASNKFLSSGLQIRVFRKKLFLEFKNV
jgi:hypothetical protein